MYRILYGVSGDGFGHSSRAKVVAHYLEKKGHIVKIVSYHKGYDRLSELFDVQEIKGFLLEYKKNKVQYISTVLKNIVKFPEVKKSFDKVVTLIEEFKPDIIITDFEPITCLAGNYKKIPVISLDNQHRITRTKLEYPLRYKQSAFASAAIIRMMTIKASAYIITDFGKPEIISRNTFVIPPILREDILEIKDKTIYGDSVLVYVTSPYADLPNILKETEQNYIVYGYDKNEVDANIVYKKVGDDFLQDLKDCKAVIGNAGFSLMSESLYLQKPYFAIPIAKQFEQIINAYQLKEYGFGDYTQKISVEKIQTFLENQDLFRKNLTNFEYSGNQKLYKTIDFLLEQLID